MDLEIPAISKEMRTRRRKSGFEWTEFGEL